MKKIFLTLVLLFWTKILLAAPLVIKLSHVTGENTPKNLSALKFKEIVERKLRGRVQLFEDFLLKAQKRRRKGGRK